MAEHRAPMTSEQLAKAMQTHPVVIRRILGGLRDAGFVHSEKGHGGGWTIAKELSAITMRDVYDAIGRPGLMAMGHRTEAPGCLVQPAVNAALDTIVQDAEALPLPRFGEVPPAPTPPPSHPH